MNSAVYNIYQYIIYSKTCKINSNYTLSVDFSYLVINMLSLLLLIQGVLCSTDTVIQSSIVSSSTHLDFNNQVPSSKDAFQIPLTNINNQYYLTQISIGSSEQPFNLLLDISSSWLWVSNSRCFECPEFTNKFDSTQSNTYRRDHKKRLDYISGIKGYDTIHLGQNKTVKDQPIIVADKVTRFDSTYADGVLGLGFTSYKDFNSSITLNLKKQNLIEEGIFSLYLHDIYNSSSPNSVILIGGYYINPLSSDITENWVDLTTKDNWEVPFYGFNYNTLTLIEPSYAVFTTTTPQIYVPSHIYKKIQLQIFQNNNNACSFDEYIICDCSQIQNLGMFEFYIGSYTFDIDSKDMFYIDGNKCKLLLYSWKKGYWLLGTVFIRKYSLIFDIDRSKIGIVGPRIASFIDEVRYDIERNLGVENMVGIVIVAMYGGITIAGIYAIYRSLKGNRREGDEELTYIVRF